MFLFFSEQPSNEEFQSLDEYYQNRAKFNSEARQLVRGQRQKVYTTHSKGRHFKNPTKVKIGNKVLARRDLITTNKVNNKKKLQRVYTRPYTIVDKVVSSDATWKNNIPQKKTEAPSKTSISIKQKRKSPKKNKKEKNIKRQKESVQESCAY